MNISFFVAQYFLLVILVLSNIAYDLKRRKLHIVDEHRHHNYNNKMKNSKQHNKMIYNKPKFDFDSSKKSFNQVISPMKHFRDHLQRLNEKVFDDLYFCSSIFKGDVNTSDVKQLWILRNKKCLNFSDTKLDFFQAFEICKNQPYSQNYLISKSEIVQLIKNKNNLQNGIDIYQTYFKLLIAENYRNRGQDKRENKNETRKVSIWLNDDYLMSQECEARDYAPVIHIDEKNCEYGCFECVPRNATSVFYSICSKSCNWKVPYHSFCNTMKINEFVLNKNLYYQRGN